jgi:hypothetical protein
MTTATKLQNAISAVNRRYATGLNDDDQVGRMCNIDKKTKGFSFLPMYDSYKLVTDKEKLQTWIEKYGPDSRKPNSQAIENLKKDFQLKGGTGYYNELLNSFKAVEPEKQTSLF